MRIRTLLTMIAAGILLPLCSQAQLGRQIARLHDTKGATITLLDKNLYGLYQRNNLPKEAAEALQQLDEVNIVNLDFKLMDARDARKTTEQFADILNRDGDYRLIKSHKGEAGKQLIYTKSGAGNVSDLVVWNETPQNLELIELRGKIQLEKIAIVSRALNIKGLNSLWSLSANEESYQAYKRHFETGDYEEMFRLLESEIKKLENRMESRHPGNSHLKGFSNDQQMDAWKHFFSPLAFLSEQMEAMMAGKDSGHYEKMMESMQQGPNTSSSSVRITEENGKTKIKIDSKNADMNYVIDGVLAPKDNVEMPESILHVNIVPSKKDMRKSYLFVISRNKLGEFTSYRDGLLKFRYKGQEYSYQLKKSGNPLLVVDGRLCYSLETDPNRILQIRPISQIEKEAGYYPHAEVIINTK